MASLNLIVTPPASTRASKSKVDPALLKAMADQIKPDQWVSNGEQYKTYKEAVTAAGPFRRALPKALNVPAHQIKSKTWGTDAKGVVVTDRTKTGTWVFAFSVDPTRQARAPRQRAAATA